jgi:Signal transduction histidine kinase
MKFRVRLAVAMVWLLAAAFGIGGSLIISLSFENSMDREQQAAYHSYQMTVRALQLVNSVGSQTDYSDAVATLKKMAGQSGWPALRLSAKDSVLYATGDAADSLNTSDDDSVSTNSCRVTAFSDKKGNEYLQLSSMIETDSDLLRLDIAYDITSTYAARQEQQSAYHEIFLVLALVGAALSWGLAALLTQPLRKLSKVAREIAGGNLACRADVHTSDEVGQLADDFNNMADKVEQGMGQLRDAMERQERFMGSFAHELKTPMTSIIGYADLLRTQSLAPEDQMDAANYIFSEGKRLESLSLKLLDIIVQNNHKVNLVPSSPARLISGLAEHLKPIFEEKQIILRYKCEEGTCLLEPDLVKSLVVNLLDNARKALDDGGYICIVSEMTPDGCRISVLDNGRGIPPEALKHLTEAFYRVDKSRSRAQGGAGLGLTLCDEIAQMHHGALSFKSRVGNGTVVTAELKGGRE